MTFLLIYLFVSIEKIAAFLMIGSTIFNLSLSAYILTYLGAVVLSKGKDDLSSLITSGKRVRKYSLIFMIIGAMFYTTSSLMPTKKELAVIIAAGSTYNILTSDTAKEIGGKAIELLKKEMDNALKDVDPDAIKQQVIDKAKSEAREAINA